MAFHLHRALRMLAMMIFMSGAASAQPPPPNGTQSGVTPQDRSFLQHAAAGGMAEVELGRMAQARAANGEVKAFGERMVSDHGKANETLKQLAERKGVALPSQASAEQRKAAERLDRLSGPDFDLGYMKHMVEDHKADVAAFDKAARSDGDAEVRAFAARTLPTLQDHLQQAQSTYAQLRGHDPANRAAASSPRR